MSISAGAARAPRSAAPEPTSDPACDNPTADPADNPTADPAPDPAPGAPRRAAPLPPGDRRAALIAATLPLILASGTNVSTRQIATAAGVAEGTIFRVFPDKESLIRATIEAAVDPAPVVAALERVDPSAPLDEKLITIVRIRQTWLSSVINLMMALRRHEPHGEKQSPRRATASDEIEKAVVRLIEPDRNQLRVPPLELARLLRLLVFSSAHPIIAEGNTVPPEELVAVVLDGVRTRGARDIRASEEGTRCC